MYSTLRIIIYGVIYVFRDFPVAPVFFPLQSSLHCSHLVKRVFIFFQMLIRPPDCVKLAPLREEKIGAAMMQGPKPEPQHVIHYVINYPVRAALHGGHLITRH